MRREEGCNSASVMNIVVNGVRVALLDVGNMVADPSLERGEIFV